MADDNSSNSGNFLDFPNPVPGLLSPQQEKNARTSALLNAAVGLLQAGSTPSPVKGTSWGRGGAAVRGS
jgi:hypothetical protein